METLQSNGEINHYMVDYEYKSCVYVKSQYVNKLENVGNIP
jgi:hypothetical protein